MLEPILEMDRALFLYLNGRLGGPVTDAVMGLCSLAGTGAGVVLLLALFLLAVDRRRFWRHMVVIGLILLAGGLLAQVIKRIADRPRPLAEFAYMLDLADEVRQRFLFFWERRLIPLLPKSPLFDIGGGALRVLGPSLSKHSFPSGHAVTAFAAATSLFYIYRRWAVPLFLAASAVALSRICVGVHFPLDIAAGAVLGVLTAMGLLLLIDRRSPWPLRLELAEGPSPEGRKEAPRIMIVAGEASADLYGANMLREIRKLRPQARFFGVGGSLMREAGVEIVHPAESLSIMGFTEVVTAARRIGRIFRDLLDAMAREGPDLLVSIDLPDFNLALAGRARELSIPVLYYISPQVWAWRTGRIRKIASRVSSMVVAFPFEKEIFERAGMRCRYFGHPLVEIARPTMDPEAAREAMGLDPGLRTVALFPGSRGSEIRNILPEMLYAARILHERFGDLQFRLALVPTIDRKEVEERLSGSGAPIRIVQGSNYDLLAAADFGIIASGTATLEAALFELPMVIVYRGNRTNVTLARMLVKVDYFGLPNLIAKRGIVPELLQEEASGERIAEAAARILASPERLEEMRRELHRVREELSGEDVSRSVAREALEIIDGKDRGKS